MLKPVPFEWCPCIGKWRLDKPVECFQVESVGEKEEVICIARSVFVETDEEQEGFVEDALVGRCLVWGCCSGLC